jgi:hypothetical protein
MMSHAPNGNAIRAHLERLAAEQWELSKSAAAEFAFPMTDWIDDLGRLNAIFRDPGRDDAETAQVLLEVLVHVPQHIAAASFIAMGLPVTDVLMLGAVEGDGVAKREPGGEYPSGD